MPKKNPLIEELRDLGVSDYERRKLRELSRELEAGDTYATIEQLNKQLLNERVRPVTLNYETAIRLLKYNVYGSIQEIVEEYKTAKMYVEQGTTKEYEEYIDKLYNELKDVGVEGVTPSALKSSNLTNVEYYYGRYKYYEEIGNKEGMEWAKGKIEEELKG